MSDGVRTRYHIGLDSIGFMLKGAPDRPAYVLSDAPSQAGALGLGDTAYAQLNGSGWSWWAQTDWAGGFQRLKFRDDASFKDGQAIDVLDEYGKVKLQHGFTSAVAISGSHGFGASNVHNGELILGTVKAGAAKVVKITSAHVVSILSSYSGISAVNSISRFGSNSILGLTRTSGSLKTMAKWTGSALSAFRSANPIVREVQGIGTRLYSAERQAATSADILYYSTDLSTFTSAHSAGRFNSIPVIRELAGLVYFFIQDGKKVTMNRYDEFTNKVFPIYTWNDLTNFGVALHDNIMQITGTSDGVRVGYSFNGARMAQTFNDQLQDSSYDFSKPFVFDKNLHVKGAQYDGQFWFPGLYGKFATVQYTPFTAFASRAYGYATSGTILRLAYYDTTKRAISGNVESSEFGYDTGAIDKLVNSVTVSCEPLATGQLIDLQRTVDGGVTYSSVGLLRFSTDGAIKSKQLFFTSGLVTKLWGYKAVLVGNGTTTPVLTDVAFEYRPMTDLKRRWGLVVNSSDDIKLMNGQREQRNGREIMERLWLAKQVKRTMKFEDINFFSARIAANVSSAATSMKVDNVRWMPRQGRMRVVSAGVAEEMTFTSADGQTIKGISRGQLGTKARAYGIGRSVDNAHTVILNDIQERAETVDDRKLEFAAQLVLLEV